MFEKTEASLTERKAHLIEQKAEVNDDAQKFNNEIMIEMRLINHYLYFSFPFFKKVAWEGCANI